MRTLHVRLLVDDFNACFRFYRDVMGFAPQFGDEDSGYADFKAGDNIALALFARGAMSEVLGTDSLPNVAIVQDGAMLIIGVDDLDATVAHLEQRNVSFIQPPTERPDWGVRTAHLRDPNGTLIELNMPIPME